MYDDSASYFCSIFFLVFPKKTPSNIRHSFAMQLSMDPLLNFPDPVT